MAFRARKIFGTFEKRAPGVVVTNGFSGPKNFRDFRETGPGCCRCRCGCPRPCLSSLLSVNKLQIPERYYTGDKRWKAPKGIFTKPPSESRLCDAGKLCALPSDPRCSKGGYHQPWEKITLHRITLQVFTEFICWLALRHPLNDWGQEQNQYVCVRPLITGVKVQKLLDLTIHNRSYMPAGQSWIKWQADWI